MSVLTAQRPAGLAFSGLRAPLASNLGSAATSRADLPKAEFWLNFGYQIDIQKTVDGQPANETRFVGLALGIPLDTMAKLPTNQKNAEFAQFQAARNDLHDQLMEVASKLTPGQEHVIAVDPNNGLCVQIRRVNSEIADAKADGANIFVQRLGLVA